MVLTILVFLLILSVLVLIHEAGHYFVAKWFGIKVEEFGFGFPPRAIAWKRGETEYSINWLPIGGFVKLYGEDDAGGGKISVKHQAFSDKDKDRAFFAQNVWKRALVVVAGVVMNAVLAVVIFYVFLAMSGFKTELPLLTDHKFFGVTQHNQEAIIVNVVAKNSPAEQAGMKPFTKILSVAGKSNLSASEFVSIVKEHKGQPIELSWEDPLTHKTSHGTVVPRANPPKGEGALGVGFGAVKTAELSYQTPAEKLFSGITHPVNLMVYNFDVMGRLIGTSFEKKTFAPVSEGVSGPVGIAGLVGSILEIGQPLEVIKQLLNLAGILSISLAFFNVLPIPALDGGRLFFILFEGITGKKINARYESLAHSIGMVILLGLILLITFKDVSQLLFGAMR